MWICAKKHASRTTYENPVGLVLMRRPFGTRAFIITLSSSVMLSSPLHERLAPSSITCRTSVRAMPARRYFSKNSSAMKARLQFCDGSRANLINQIGRTKARSRPFSVARDVMSGTQSTERDWGVVVLSANQCLRGSIIGTHSSAYASIRLQ